MTLHYILKLWLTQSKHCLEGSIIDSIIPIITNLLKELQPLIHIIKRSALSCNYLGDIHQMGLEKPRTMPIERTLREGCFTANFIKWAVDKLHRANCCTMFVHLTPHNMLLAQLLTCDELKWAGGVMLFDMNSRKRSFTSIICAVQYPKFASTFVLS